jgi:alpha-D-xyloside xylohydrolase
MKRFLPILLAIVAAIGQQFSRADTFNELVVFEAEDFTTNISRSAHDWVLTNAIPGFSGAGYMQALPDNGSNINVNITTTSPELQYGVNFVQTAPYNVWVRGYASDADGDSVHLGIDGTVGSAGSMTFQNLYNAWAWTNRTMAGNVATLTVGSSGTHTVSLWMREDGMRVDRVILTTNANFQPVLGESFHIPGATDANIGGATMRSPVTGIVSNTSPAIFSGNQAAGAGNPGNQLQSGSAIVYRHATNTTWSSTNMLFFSEGPSPLNPASTNKYYRGFLPPFNPGDVVQYYLRIPYSDRLPTFLFGNDNVSLKSEFERDARADPFSYTVQWPLAATGGYLAITNATSGAEARIYTNSGHIALGSVATFAPPAAIVGGESHTIGRVLSSAPIAGGLELRQALGATSVVARLTFPYDGVMRYEVVDWGGPAPSETSISAASDASEHFYGFGEKFNAFDQAGNKVRIITDDPPGTKGDKSYKVAPWFISTKGYGFHLDSSAESWFDMRAQYADRYVVSNMFSTLKFNVVAGPKLTDVLSRYTGYTGRPQMSPPWAFAPWMSSDIWRDGGEVRYVITKYRERGIPGSVLVFDSPWERGYNDFIWNTNQFQAGNTYEGAFYNGFTTIGDMMTFLRTNGFYAVCWMTPFINNAGITGEVPGQQALAANYNEALASNYFVRVVNAGVTNLLSVNWWKGSGSPLDYTNPNAALWAQKQLSNLVAQSSSGGFNVIGGFKTDDGESGNPPGSYIPKNALYFDGRTGAEMQNGYSAEYHKTIWNVLGTNGVLFARSGFTGSQAHPGYWCGDNEPNFGQDNGLQSVVVAGQSAAMSGYSTWASDIGGYQNSNVSSTPTNLFMRWTQFGAFSPVMQMHRQIGANNQYPWSYGAEALTNYQFYAKLHTALFPYIYSYAKEASTNGLPIIRPVVLLHQDDPNVYGLRHTYYFGNELYIAPVVTNTATTRIVYLPAGIWHDFFAHTVYTGGQNIVWTNANQSIMPVFARDGAIIPMISTNVQTLCDASYVSNPNIVTMDNTLEFRVYPTTNSGFNVYDGTTAHCQSNGTVVTFNLTSSPRPVTLHIRGPAFGVERDGVRIPLVSSSAEFDAASFVWRYDGTFVHVKFPHTGGSTQIRLGPDSVGDGISDSWRLTHFGTATTTNESSCATCDADGDGLTNEQEYAAGTGPQDSTNRLRITAVQRAGNDVLLNFPTVLGRKYRVEYRDDMAAGSWQPLQTNVTGTDGMVSITDAGAAGLAKRFYRAFLLP